MAYEKQTWECGETITAEKLNHIEDGIANASSGRGTLRVKIDRVEDGVTYYDHTWQEVHDALERGDYVTWEFGFFGSNTAGASQIILAIYRDPLGYIAVGETFDENGARIVAEQANAPWFDISSNPNAYLQHTDNQQ